MDRRVKRITILLLPPSIMLLLALQLQLLLQLVQVIIMEEEGWDCPPLITLVGLNPVVYSSLPLPLLVKVVVAIRIAIQSLLLRKVGQLPACRTAPAT